MTKLKKGQECWYANTNTFEAEHIQLCKVAKDFVEYKSVNGGLIYPMQKKFIFPTQEEAMQFLRKDWEEQIQTQRNAEKLKQNTP